MGDRQTEEAQEMARSPTQPVTPLSLTQPILPHPYLPVEDVIILTAPSPVLVGKAVDPQKLGLTQARHTSKVASIGQPMTWESRC